MTHSHSYRKWYSCARISVSQGGKGDTMQRVGIYTGTVKPIFPGLRRREGQDDG